MSIKYAGLLGLLLVISTPLSASSPGLMPPLLLAEGNITVEAAIRTAKQHYQGQVLGARYDDRQGVYKVKIVSPDGRVQQVWVDARSGQVVGGG